MNNNKLDEAAILAGCKGVFQKTSYITIGTEGCVLAGAVPIRVEHGGMEGLETGWPLLL